MSTTSSADFSFDIEDEFNLDEDIKENLPKENKESPEHETNEVPASSPEEAIVDQAVSQEQLESSAFHNFVSEETSIKLEEGGDFDFDDFEDYSLDEGLNESTSEKKEHEGITNTMKSLTINVKPVVVKIHEGENESMNEERSQTTLEGVNPKNRKERHQTLMGSLTKQMLKERKMKEKTRHNKEKSNLWYDRDKKWYNDEEVKRYMKRKHVVVSEKMKEKRNERKKMHETVSSKLKQLDEWIKDQFKHRHVKTSPTTSKRTKREPQGMVQVLPQPTQPLGFLDTIASKRAKRETMKEYGDQIRQKRAKIHQHLTELRLKEEEERLEKIRSKRKIKAYMPKLHFSEENVNLKIMRFQGERPSSAPSKLLHDGAYFPVVERFEKRPLHASYDELEADLSNITFITSEQSENSIEDVVELVNKSTQSTERKPSPDLSMKFTQTDLSQIEQLISPQPKQPNSKDQCSLERNDNSQSYSRFEGSLSGTREFARNAETQFPYDLPNDFNVETGRFIPMRNENDIEYLLGESYVDEFMHDFPEVSQIDWEYDQYVMDHASQKTSVDIRDYIAFQNSPAPSDSSLREWLSNQVGSKLLVNSDRSWPSSINSIEVETIFPTVRSNEESDIDSIDKESERPWSSSSLEDHLNRPSFKTFCSHYRTYFQRQIPLHGSLVDSIPEKGEQSEVFLQNLLSDDPDPFNIVTAVALKKKVQPKQSESKSIEGRTYVREDNVPQQPYLQPDIQPDTNSTEESTSNKESTNLDFANQFIETLEMYKQELEKVQRDNLELMKLHTEASSKKNMEHCSSTPEKEDDVPSTTYPLELSNQPTLLDKQDPTSRMIYSPDELANQLRAAFDFYESTQESRIQLAIMEQVKTVSETQQESAAMAHAVHALQSDSRSLTQHNKELRDLIEKYRSVTNPLE